MFKFIIFIALFATPFSLDLCNEYQSFTTCITSINGQCKWDTSSLLCKSTTEFLDGCSIYLNKRSCVKQLGTTSGELSKCRFTTLCETIPDLKLEVCTSSLSKHGCLSIQNPTSLCYWDTTTYTCQTLPNNENYKLNFASRLYSASVCQHIQGYLVMHSSLLWAQLSYSPNLVKEAQNQFRSDLNLAIDTVDKNYENEQTQLKNNYVDDNTGNFIPYIVGQPLASALTNVKISDREREGCIALQIQDDDDFQSLMITFDDKLFGVNHIYCRYLFEQTTPTMAVFAGGACVKISDTLQLKDQTFISSNSIICTSMSHKFCSFFYSKLQTCEIPSKTKEFSCSVLVSTLPATYDCATHTQDIYYLCRLNDKCYLDETTFQCTSIGSYSPTDCAKQPLLTIKSEITATMTNFQYCSPVKKCLTFGIGKWYCKNIPYLCQWNQLTSECSDVYMYELKTMKCTQATTKFTCSSVTVAGQHCIWLDEDQLCVNVVENALFMSFLSFPSSLSVNRNLCVNYSQGNYKFNQITRLCETIQTTDTYTCVTAIDVNKEYCLSLKDCKWDERNAICSAFDGTGQSCTSLVNVSNTVCKTAITVPSKFCVYDQASFSCVLQLDIQCTTEGVQKSDCLAITSKANYCNWIDEKCTSIQENYIFSENCYAFQNVNARVCVTHSYSSQPCAYDAVNKNCYSTIVPSTTCSNLLNAYACQLATPECYFYEGCQAITDYSFITCEGLYITKAACLKVNKVGLKCYFDTSCKTLDFTPNECASLGTLGNETACLSLQVSSSKALDVGNYCEYSTGSGCVSTITTIGDCGSSSKINIHRCGAYSTGFCIFKDNQCQDIVSTTKIGQQYLKTIGCTQANLQTCSQVSSSACLVTNAQYSTLQVDKRCSYFNNSLLCSILGTMAGGANSSVCSLAADSCYHNGTKCIAVPNTTTFYKCDQAGLSSIPCLTQTYGKCMFVNQRCQAADDTTECSKRNRWACLDVRKIKCTFKDGLCISSSEDCDIVDRVGYPIVESWSVCSIAIGECYGQQGICVKASKDLSCNVPGMSKKVCLGSSVQLCQYVDFRCQIPENKSCEESLTIDQCGQNINYDCVYRDGKCFSQGLIDRCDRYEYTNYRFCRKFSKCTYIDQKCVDQSVILDQLKSQIVSVTSNCSSFTNRSDCLFQLNLRCQYESNGFCGVSTHSYCPHLLGNNYSKYSCIYFDHCKFGLTKTGGYCYNDTQTFTCEDMGQDLCLADISDNYKCIWDGSNCITNTYTTCSSSNNIQMNYPACISISNNDSNKCQYQFETSYCKIINIPTSICTDASNQFDIECALIIQQSCYLTNLGGSTYSCTIGTAFDVKLNRFGCIALTGANYYYNEMTYQCTLISDLTLISDCSNLNKDACISITSQLMFYCYWNSSSCNNLNAVQNQQLNTCINLNQNACLKVEKTECKWNGTTCVSASLGVHGCAITSSLYSLGSCASASTEYCIINVDNTGCDTLTQQIEFCEDLGLSQLACLKNTSKTTCKWNGFCQYANLYNTLCSETVSESTCKQIQTPGQYCKWNGSNCSTITPSICTDAVSYLSCSIVQTQLCNYNSFTNQCNQIFVIPKKCLSTLNQLACRAVDGMNCIWKDDHCIQSSIAACVQIYNKMACLTSPLFCIWQNDVCHSHDTYDLQNSILCKDIVVGANKTVCLYYAKDYCQFNNLKCGVEISDWSNTTATLKISDSQDYTRSFLTGLCTDQLSQSDCIRTKTLNQACQWNTSQCLYVTDYTVPCQNLNILACLKSTQNCIWRNEQCLTDTTPSVPDVSLDISPSITCTTPDISKNTCMAITKAPCYFSNNKCQNQIAFSLMRCDLYTDVNEKVCQMITNLPCAYNALSNQCVDASSSDTLSKLACINQTLKRTYWDKKCLTISDKFYCDSEFNSNPSSCSFTYESIACAYDTINKKCTSKMSLNQLKCDSPGLNQYSCIAITTQPCIFISGKCQLFTSIDSNCDQAKIVNAVTCAYMSQDKCYYDETNQQCSQTTIQLPCSTTGLSMHACLLNSTCKWSPDQMTCICGVTEAITLCSNKTDKATCILEQTCMYGDFGCKPKNCEDYTKTTCPTSNMKCFLDLQNQCKSALKCEHITNIDVSLCSSHYFGGYSCIPAGDRCATYNNYELICPYSDCLNQNCIKDTSCRARQCTDLNMTNCSTIQKCKLIDSVCSEITTCSQFNSDGGQCVITNLNGSNCNYQQHNIYSDEQVCTSQPCAIYGSSSTLCHGNEMADFTCYLDRRLNCMTCEQITDQCTCSEALGICSWQNNSCQSVLCSNFESQSTCEQLTRCQWSEYWHGCTIHCNKLISQQACDFRVGECYYNKLTNFCEVGILTEPDLTVKIDIQVIYSVCLLIPIAIMIFL